MSSVKAFVWIIVGIVISLVLPVLAVQIKVIFQPEAVAFLSSTIAMWPYIRTLLLTSAFAVITALIVLAYITKSGGRVASWADALLYGFAWDSVLQKLITA